MEVQVLGPLAVRGDSGTVAIGSRSQRVVLAVLAARPGLLVESDRLVDALWGDEPPPTASTTLRSYVSRLRRILGDTLRGAPGGYRLTAAVDASRFEALVEQADREGPEIAATLLQEALGLWRGPAFGDVADVDAVRGEALRLTECRSDAIERLGGALLEAGRPGSAVALAEAVVADQPLHEGAWTLLVRSLASCDRTADALRAYQRAVAELAEAGLEPGASLRAAEQAALTGRPAEQPLRATGAAPAKRSRHLVGRDDELGTLRSLLDEHPMVCLVGPGGVGKTALALELASLVGPCCAQGSVVVELAALSGSDASAGTVVGAVVDALGVRPGPGSDVDPLEHAARLDVLVVLDNCEHLVDAAAAVAERLTLPGSTARVVATSRERLGVPGELVWTVQPLTADGGAAARTLFLERARAAHPRLQVGPAELAAIDRITRRVDGLPLGIEMAAARVATMGVVDLADLLEDRLDVLRSSLRHGDARHRTLRAVLEWSEALLEPDEQATLAALSVFAGSVGADDLRAVLDDPRSLERVASLAERSLVMVSTHEGHSRYGLLGTVRAFAAERLASLGRAATLRERHARWFADAAATADRRLRTTDEGLAHEWFETTMDELRSAHGWARDHDLDLAVAISRSTHAWSRERQRAEVATWTTALLERLDADDPRAGCLLAGLAHHHADAGDLDRAEATARRALELSTDTRTCFTAIDALADVTMYRGDLRATRDNAKEMARLADESGDRFGRAVATLALALSEAYAGRAGAGAAVLARMSVGSDDSPSLRGWLAYGHGEVSMESDPATAQQAFERAVALADSVGNRFLSGVARVSLASLHARSGSADEARAAFADLIQHWLQRRDRTHQATTLRNLVAFLCRSGEYPTATRLLGTLQRDDVKPSFGGEAERLLDAHRAVVEALGEASVDRLLAAGAAQDLDTAAQGALDHLHSRD